MIIGLSGIAGSGKDTAADHLVKNHGFVKVSLADPLKRICAEVFGFSEEQLWGPSAARNAPDMRYSRGRFLDQDTYEDIYLTPRYALQKLGTEWGRDCFSNVWVDYALRIAQQLDSVEKMVRYSPQTGICPSLKKHSYRGVVIPDVRFRNEIDALKAAGGRIFRITRDTAGLSGSGANHASEREQQEVPNTAFNAVIPNNGSLDSLYECLDLLVGV